MIRRITLAFLLVAIYGLQGVADETRHQSATTRIAVYCDVGAGRSIDNLTTALADADALSITKVTAAEIRSGALNQFDVLIHPGGSGSKQGNQLGEDGRQAVRSFVRDGGGFIGICAGAYLASADYSWSLHILDAKMLDRKHWARGTGTVQIKLTNQGRKILDDQRTNLKMYYGQGPLLAPAKDPNIPDYFALGTYETEIAKRGVPKGVMIGTTAIAASPFGQGRVFCFSPHPEKTDGLGSFVLQAVHWVSAPEDPGRGNRSIQDQSVLPAI